TEAGSYGFTTMPAAPTTGTVSTNARHAWWMLARFWESEPPYQIDDPRLDGVCVHILCTVTATPTSGTRTVKYGGSAERPSRAISSRRPSALTSTMCEGTPLATASNRLTALRTDRRTGRLSRIAMATKQVNM